MGKGGMERREGIDGRLEHTKVRPWPTVAGKVAAFALTTPVLLVSGWEVWKLNAGDFAHLPARRYTSPAW
jgi:hypothetical protein